MTQQTMAIQTLVEQALQILAALGIPLSGLTVRRQQKMAKPFLAVAGLRPGMTWTDVQDNHDGRQLTSRQIIAFMNAHLGETIADSSYDDIRRKDLLLPEAALVVLKSAKNPDANTNDGTRGFALNPVAAIAIRQFGISDWDDAVGQFMLGRETLARQLQRERQLARIAVQLPDGVSLNFGPGKHNVLQKQIIEVFLSIFGFGAEVLYVGDTANKSLFLNSVALEKLEFFELAHDKLPDVVAWSQSKNWLYLIEAVTTANPITELRRRSLLALTQSCTADVVFITAFPDRHTYLSAICERHRLGD